MHSCMNNVGRELGRNCMNNVGKAMGLGDKALELEPVDMVLELGPELEGTMEESQMNLLRGERMDK